MGVVFAVVLLGATASCGPSVSHYRLVDEELKKENYAGAASLVEKNKGKYGKRNSLVYFMDRGFLLHLAGDYGGSNRFLALAEDRMEALYTQSLTAGAGAMITNDNTLPYEGEDFEKVMVNLVSAMNYTHLGEWDEALVEIRKVNHKLGLFNDRYPNKAIYKDDAFAHYLSGLLYETKGEFNDAFISYRKSLEAYEVYREAYGTPFPPPLPSDLLRLSEVMGFEEEHREYRARFSETSWISSKDMKKKSEVVFLNYIGRVPVKEDYFIDAPVPIQGDEVYILRVALPRFVPRPHRVKTIEVHVIPVKEDPESDQRPVVSRRPFLVENVERIAVKNLEDRVGRIRAKAVARAVAKYQMTRVAGNESGILAQIGANIFSLATEQSDKRSWRTLPGQIQMSRILVEPGTYEVAVEYFDDTNGFIARRSFPGLRLEAGERRFLFDRMLGN